MISGSAGRSLVRHVLLGAGVMLAPAPALAAEPMLATQFQAAALAQAEGEMRSFYAHKAPLWIRADGSIDPAANALLRLLETAEVDGLSPTELGAGELAAAVQLAQSDRSPAALARAELMLSRALAAYVEATLRPTGGAAMIYEHEVLQPIAPSDVTVLMAAADAASLEEYIAGMRWLHPLYGTVRRQLADAPADASLRHAAMANLERLRAIPAPQWDRHVVIDAGSATLWMYEGDRPVDSMKVVVGKADTQTPIMAGYIRYATLNPYWNVPSNLVQKTIATNVINMGVGYLKSRGYEVLSGWEPDATVVDPKTVDWRAVKRGEIEVVVRQKPGGTNAMGAVKYEFPNPQGIYLHDTPDRQLLQKEARQFSNGCVRLEDAARLGRWLFGGAMPEAGAAPEQRVDIAQPVPVFITYLTVRPGEGAIALGPDPYALDAVATNSLALAH
jgi:murein L,D-transpeptidase YcbB/YkuD